jgi:predicted RNA-binding protein with RPS1 domain
MREVNNEVRKKDPKDKIYCQEPYAQELYDLMCGIPVIRKDVKKGDILMAYDLRVTPGGNVEVLTQGFMNFSLDFRKEKKYFSIIGMEVETVEDLKEHCANGEFKEFFSSVKQKMFIDDERLFKGSLYDGYLQSIKDEFFTQKSVQNVAYEARIVDKNLGGFFIEVQGIQAFLPGSLAAANKIVNFDDYIGKTIKVMVEDYLPSTDTFIFSYKRYLEKILPQEIKNIESNSLMEGIITGTSKFGIFLEFNEMFTGLLHVSEMDEDTENQFRERAFRPGNTMEVWVKDVKDNRLILTMKNPADRIAEIKNFRERLEGTVKAMKVISMKPFGVFFEVEENKIGLLPIREVKRVTQKKMEVGETYNLCIREVDSSGKITLSSIREKRHQETEA